MTKVVSLTEACWYIMYFSAYSLPVCRGEYRVLTAECVYSVSHTGVFTCCMCVFRKSYLIGLKIVTLGGLIIVFNVGKRSLSFVTGGLVLMAFL